MHLSPCGSPAFVDTTQQRCQIQPQILSFFNTGPLLQTPSTEDLDVACSMVQVQPKVLSGLETALVESRFPGAFDESTTAQTQTLRDFEKVSSLEAWPPNSQTTYCP
ncbi:Hypothetical predicted protein [Podarcis lilfordi]|uniref:Uncharacterized protein n=1 Tax=Podarcis lilfordi TaxID=74358 RepID=A0AA35KEY7_9SAUR|nr:Hypothetical predicted protein [Podarcis lilfordi]